jgi:D-3-phosphoglycerate dehydrogenase / 2-oxoglutarate reductase
MAQGVRSAGATRVVIYRPADETGMSHETLRDAGCEVVLGAADLPPGQLPALADGAHALMGASFRQVVLTRELLASLPALRIVSKYTIGVDDIDIDAATDLGVLVAYCPTEANWGGVAEGTVAFLLALLKKLRERDHQVKSGRWRDPSLRGVYLGARSDGHAGITVGLIGLGRVGTRVANLLAPWNVRVIAVDPYVPDEHFARHGVRRAQLEQLLRESDVVSLHCNLTHETRGIINAQALGWMAPHAVLINTARGPLVDVEALADALESRALRSAALDVLPEEPPPADARLLAMGDRVLLSPHMIAANEGGTLAAAVPWATTATLRALRGELPEHICNREVVPQWLARFGGRSLL